MAICLSLKPSELKTCDLFAAIHGVLSFVFIKRYPCLNEFVYRQKVCLHNRKKPCDECLKAIKETEARVEAEIKAESEQASSEVTATTSKDDVKKEEDSEESEPESVTNETPSIVKRDPENLKSTVESSFAEAETKPIPTISKSEVSEHNPSCLKAIKKAESEQAPSSVTTTTSGGNVDKEENSEGSKPAPSVAINTPVEDEINRLPAISEQEVTEQHTFLPSSNIHICEKCMETSNEAREEVMETYRKMMILEKKLKEKDAELERLRVYEEKSKKSGETEKKMKNLEKEAEEWKMKHFKILEENVRMGNMLKSSVNSKALENQFVEMDKQLKLAQKALEEKEQKCKDLEKAVKEKLLEAEKNIETLTSQLMKKTKDLEESKKERNEIYKMLDSSILNFERRLNELELKNSKHTAEQNQEIEKLKKLQAMVTKENKKEMEQLKRNASTSADEIKKLTARIAEKEGAEDLLKRSNKGLLEKLQKSESSLKEVTNRRAHLETEITDKNRIILELQKSAENQVSEQEKAKEELEAEVSTIRAILDRISPRSDSECLICLDEMKPDQKTLKCKYCRKVVHLKCASQWLKVHRSCAHCRREQLDPTEFPSLR